MKLHDDSEIVIVNAGGNLAQLCTLIVNSGSSVVRLIDLPGERFNKAQALNVGAHFSRGDCIFMVDADVLLTADTLRTARRLLANGTFVTIRKVTESRYFPSSSLVTETIHTAEYVCSDGRRASIEYRAGADRSRCGPGLILVRRRDFISIGGFNSALKGWGFEDYDFQLRLQFALRLQRVTACDAVHLTHDGLRDPMQSRTNRRNRAISEGNYSRGKFTGTYLQDVKKWRRKVAERDPIAVCAGQSNSVTCMIKREQGSMNVRSMI